MTKKKNCKICKEYSGKKNVCLDCKINFPYKPSHEGREPFERLDEYLGIKKRK